MVTKLLYRAKRTRALTTDKVPQGTECRGWPQTVVYKDHFDPVKDPLRRPRDYGYILD